MKKIHFCLFFILFIFTMCNKSNNKLTENQKGAHKLDTVFVTYCYGNVDTSVAFDCEMFEKIQKQHKKNDYSSSGSRFIDTVIVDSQVLNQLEKSIFVKLGAEEFHGDIRMFATLKYLDGYRDEICIDAFGQLMKFNGSPFYINSETLFLLRNYSGY